MLPKNQAELLEICSLQAYFRAKLRPNPALVTNNKQIDIQEIYDRDIFIGVKYTYKKIFVTHKLETQCQSIISYLTLTI